MNVDLKKTIGLGVSGNFAGHLEQAAPNLDVGSSTPNAPKGIFPFYVPSQEGRFVETYPLSSDRLVMPYAGAQIQIEPEVALLCEVTYDGDRVAQVTPRTFTAYNDCSLHDKDVHKISEKKNWGPHSKGVSTRFIEIDTFREGGIMDRYRLACYLHRDGELHVYGVNSPLPEYSYFHETLITWLVNQMNTQQDSGAFESIHDLLLGANRPAHALVGIGATRYTELGQTTYLQAGDESIVAVYDAQRYSVEDIEQRLREGRDEGEGLSVLRQTVVSA